MMSSYGDEFRPGVTPSAARVGADLRAARERLGWSLPDMAAHLRIRLPFLEAIEDGRTGDLPGNAYAVGFLRTYAQSLGLDPDEVARRFRAEAAEANRKTELKFPAPVPERGVPAGAIVLVGALIAVGAYIGWYRMSGSSHSATQVVQTVPERLAPLAETAPPPAASGAQAPAAKGTDAALPAVSPTSAAAAVTPNGLAAVVVPGTAPGGTAAATAAAAALVLATPAPVPPSPLTDTARPDGGRILLRAKADAWVQVREKGGQVLLNRVLRAGESWTVPSHTAVLLTTGNAAGTEVVIDGVASGPLGGDGAVRRDIPLDTDAIKDGRLAPPKKT